MTNDLWDHLADNNPANIPTVQFLIEHGTDLNGRDAHGRTFLHHAVEHDDIGLVAALLDAGADVNAVWRIETMPRSPGFLSRLAAKMVPANIRDILETDIVTTAATECTHPDIARLLAKHGADLSAFEADMFPHATGADLIPAHEITKDIFNHHGMPRFGTKNPETSNDPFYLEQIRTGLSGYAAGQAVIDTSRRPQSAPIWSFQRFGRSITRLGDGRIVLIAGEHEDHYDNDFNIYNDVTVLDGNGGVIHYLYPKDIFPPTDFHTATLLSDHILLIGSLGYPQDRREGVTQVLRLNLTDFSIARVTTTGTNPGWINCHTATLEADRIIVEDGKVEPGYTDLQGRYALDLTSYTWEKLPK